MTKQEIQFRVWLNKQIKDKSLSQKDRLFALSALLEFKKRGGTIS